MNLPMRQNKKRDQALDAVASLAKTWSEWRLGEKAVKSVAVGRKKAKKAAKQASKTAKSARKTAKKTDVSSITDAVKGTPLKVAGAVALVGGVGAAIAKKLKGGGHAEPLYTPPPAPAPMPPPADLKNVPAPEPTAVVVGDLAPESDDADDEPQDDAKAEAEAKLQVDAEPEPAADAEPEPAAAAADDGAAEPAADVTEPVVPDDAAAEADADADATEPAAEPAAPAADDDDDAKG
jgi:hypothetical protein